jgi:hypothetical protein
MQLKSRIVGSNLYRMGLFDWKSAPKSSAAHKPGFLEDEAVRRYLEFGRSTDLWSKGDAGTRWDGRVIHSTTMPPDLEELTIEVLLTLQTAIQLEYKLDAIYPDCLSLVRWLPGDFQEPHADAENPDGELHPFWWRKYAALIYLNRDFEGGDLYFPNKKIRVRPQPKSLVMFPGTMEYLHEVEKITGGTRYTLASFWTDDPTKAAYPKTFAKGH